MPGYLSELENGQKIEKICVQPNSFDDITLRLELSNICNHKCLFCPNSEMQRKRCHMNSDLVYRLLSEGSKLGIKKVGLFITGEPFASPELEKYIRFAKENDYTYVFITTNGAMASPDRLEKVMEAGVDSIKFSINAGTRESYKIVHGVDDYEKVWENLMYADRYRKRRGLHVKLLSSFVVTKYTQKEIEEHYEKITPYVDEICFFKAESFGGDMKNDDLEAAIGNDNIPQYALPNRLPCAELFKTICVTAEGYLTCCCNEAFNYLVTVDVNDLSLEEAWNSDAMQDIRKRHIEGDIDGTQCYKCIYGVAKSEIKPLNEKLYQASVEK